MGWEDNSTSDEDVKDSEDTANQFDEQELDEGLVARNDTGVVAHFNSEEKYGFISTSEVTDDVFFHTNDFVGEYLGEGDGVQYDIYRTERRYKAVNVGHYQRDKSFDDPFASTRTRWGK